jgi:ATP-binding cassette subfamily B protein
MSIGNLGNRLNFFKAAVRSAISNISFSAKPGEITAIIGGTGSGKSTDFT